MSQLQLSVDGGGCFQKGRVHWEVAGADPAHVSLTMYVDVWGS